MQKIILLAATALGWIACGQADGSTAGLAAHTHGPHVGLVAPFRGGSTTGYLELKLHDDKGDLELWLGQDAQLTTPFELPIDATVEVEFTDRAGRKVTLRPRDRSKNADESGNANLRDGKTNYFIYPSNDDEDAAWLEGKDFKAVVVVRFIRDGSEFVSQKLQLAPHTH